MYDYQSYPVKPRPNLSRPNGMVNRVPIPQFTVPVLDRTWVLLPRYLEKCILPGVLFFLNTRKQVPVPFPGA